MGSLPELRRLPQTQPRHSFGALAGLQVNTAAVGARPLVPVTSASNTLPAQTLPPALLEGASGRRRESAASSVGAASVRRLVRSGVGSGLAAGGGGGGRGGRGHGLPAGWAGQAASVTAARAVAAAALLPLYALQGASMGGRGAWPPGSSLLTALHTAAMPAALFTPMLIHAVGARRLLPVAYLVLAFFFAAHAYPQLFILLPAYISAGLCWSPLTLAHDSVLVSLSVEGAGGQNSVCVDQHTRRTLIRRLLRASRAARDLGLLLACVLLPMLPTGDQGVVGNRNSTMNATSFAAAYLVGDEGAWMGEETACGARGCPDQVDVVITSSLPLPRCLPWVLAALCLCAAGLSLISCRGAGAPVAPPPPWRAAISAATDKRMRTAAPLALFIGLERGFLYTHFLQWYVVCVSGEGQLWRALSGAALLRALVAGTLSMLLAHGRRRLVTAVGLMWHACLLLALSAWRAASEDRQLPLVMAAAWAGCDAVWDLLLPSVVEESSDEGCGRAALAQCLRSLGLALACCARAFLCTRWALRAMFLALPAAAIPLLFAADHDVSQDLLL